MQKFRLKIPYRYRDIVKKQKKIDRLLIGRKFYDIRDHVRSKSFHRFYSKWEIGCTVPKNSNKSDVRSKKISPFARKVLEVPTSLDINFSTIEVGLHCNFHPEKTSLYHSLIGEIYSTENR